MSQGRATVSSLESQRKGGLGDRFRGLTQDELLLPIAPLVVRLVGSLRVQEMCACGGRRRGKGRRRCAPGSVPLEPLPIYLFIFREKGREGEREEKKHQYERETLIACFFYAPYQGLNPQPRHVP